MSRGEAQSVWRHLPWLGRRVDRRRLFQSDPAPIFLFAPVRRGDNLVCRVQVMNPKQHMPSPAIASAADQDQSLNKRLFEGSPDCIEVLDLDGRLLSMNGGWTRVLGVRDASLVIGSSWIDFWRDADHEAAQAAVKAARDGGIGRFVGSFPATQTGKPMWFDVVVSPILDTDGKPERLLAASRDVTESKCAERTLRAISEQTAGVTGNDFFHSLARTAAQTMGARYA